MFRQRLTYGILHPVKEIISFLINVLCRLLLFLGTNHPLELRFLFAQLEQLILTSIEAYAIGREQSFCLSEAIKQSASEI